MIHSEYARNKWFDAIFMIFKGIDIENIPKRIDINKINDMLQKQKQNENITNVDDIDINHDHESKKDDKYDSNGPSQEFTSHRIVIGETLISLSVKYGVSTNKIKAHNTHILGNRLGHIA